MTSSTMTQFIDRIISSPNTISFSDVMSLIADHYAFTPTRFTNGLGADKVINKEGSNEGSCRIFAFALIHQLTQEQTLHCFGDYYRKDVLGHPEANDHANIRTFMKEGWEGISFDQPALVPIKA